MSTKSAAPRELQEKIHQYEQFIEGTLKKDLAKVQQQQQQIQSRHSEYSSLRQSLLVLQSSHAAQLGASGSVAPQKSMINLGNEFYMQTVVSGATAKQICVGPRIGKGHPDPTRLFLDVGLNFHVELTLSEALAWIDLKLPSLDRKLSSLSNAAAMIQSKIKIVYEGIAEIMQLQQQKQKPQREVF